MHFNQEIDSQPGISDSIGPTRKFVLLLKKFSPFLKLAVAASALWALIRFNRLDLEIFANLWHQWPWVILAVGLVLPSYLVVAFRLFEVLRIQALSARFGQCLRWTMIGSFFDLCMPSSSGGDVVKAGYVAKTLGPGSRLRGVMAVTLDRVVGLLALFLLAWVACLPAWKSLRELSGGSALFGTLTIVCVAGLSGLRLLGSSKARNSACLDRAVHRLPWGASLWDIAGAFHAMRMQRTRFWAVVGLSVINHLISCLALFCICRAMGLEVEFLKGLIVFPIAIFSNVFGVAGGFGLGTLGFDILFSRFFGLSDGAAVGLTYQILMAATKLLGLPFFVFGESK